ncbi:TPA: multicopper oxidase domain-containing protein [Legionella pneumophila]
MLGRGRLHFISIITLSLFLCPSYLLAQHEHHMTSMTSATSTKLQSKTPQIKKQGAKKQRSGSKTIPGTFGKERVINLVVGYKMVNYAGKLRRAIAVNNQIPAPTLHFKEGERVTINVFNHLDKGTSIHWHGILVPWQMDGVENVSQKAIQPGGIFHYRFTLYQAGTYWYHAHADVQEQDGLYGAFLIDPQTKPHYQYTKDYVIVLSDWSNLGGDQVFANLKKDGDYFSPRFPLQPSLSKFIHDYRKADVTERKKLIGDYKMMQQMRMSIYDLSDVAYDAYLLNGQPKTCPWRAPVKVGDVVRLRFIGAAGSTIYRVKIPGAKISMVHVQGNDVRPYPIDDFSIAPGETEDILVKIEKNKPYIIYAESIDTRGVAIGALVTNPNQIIDYQQVTPFPEPKPVTRDMMANMMMSNMNHGSMKMNGQAHPMMSKAKAPATMNSQNHHPSMKHVPENKSGDMSNHAAHSSHLALSSQPMKHDSMKMNMEANMVKNKSSASHNMSSMPHSIPMNSKNYQMNSTSRDSMKRSAGHANHSALSDKTKNADEMKMNHTMSMDHTMEMPTEPTTKGDKITSLSHSDSKTKTIGTKYQDLTAAVLTNDPKKSVDGVIKMELFGYMDRFIWMINGLPEYKAKPILIEPGKRYRIIFTNNSMMRHPMHIHGHWFILRNGHGAYDPLLHTIEVPPGATAVADIESDASGQWFFHCHHLYHMMAGMARVFQYETIIEVVRGTMKPEHEISKGQYVNRPIVRVDEQLPIDASLISHPQGHHAGFYFASFVDIGGDPFSNAQRLTYKGLYGPDYNKLELFTNDAELSEGEVDNADIDIFYWHLISQFWAVKGGANYFYRPATSPYWQPGVGIEGIMPYFIATDLRGYYYRGSAKLDLELSRDTQLTNNFFLKLGVRSILATKTVTSAAIGNGLNQMRYIVRPYYRLMPGLNFNVEFEHEEAYGAFKTILRNLGQHSSENTLTFGFSVLF